ncbi:MAG: MotA/TolQ/ExbB proton channel family protein, partial [Myxococcales bacterium]
ELLKYLSHGGGTLFVIVLCSLLALGIAVERLLAMWSVVPSARALAEQLSKALFRGDHLQARAVCERSPAIAADIFLAGLARYGQTGKESVDAAVERERVAVILKLKSHLWALGTLGTISPFVGLFGTVVGIRTAFSAMAAAGTGGFAVVADGISEALVATGAGIFVAVEAVVFYNFFQARLGRIAAELKLITDEFVELLKERPPMPQPVPAPEPAEGAAGA